MVFTTAKCLMAENVLRNVERQLVLLDCACSSEAFSRTTVMDKALVAGNVLSKMIQKVARYNHLILSSSALDKMTYMKFLVDIMIRSVHCHKSDQMMALGLMVNVLAHFLEVRKELCFVAGIPNDCKDFSHMQSMKSLVLSTAGNSNWVCAQTFGMINDVRRFDAKEIVLIDLEDGEASTSATKAQNSQFSIDLNVIGVVADLVKEVSKRFSEIFDLDFHQISANAGGNATSLFGWIEGESDEEAFDGFSVCSVHDRAMLHMAISNSAVDGHDSNSVDGLVQGNVSELDGETSSISRVVVGSVNEGMDSVSRKRSISCQAIMECCGHRSKENSNVCNFADMGTNTDATVAAPNTSANESGANNQRADITESQMDTLLAAPEFGGIQGQTSGDTNAGEDITETQMDALLAAAEFGGIQSQMSGHADAGEDISESQMDALLAAAEFGGIQSQMSGHADAGEDISESQMDDLLAAPELGSIQGAMNIETSETADMTDSQFEIMLAVMDLD